MAENNSPLAANPTSPRGGNNNRGGRRRGGPGTNEPPRSDNRQGGPRGGFRGGRTGRGGRSRGGPHFDRPHGPSNGPIPPEAQPPGFGGGGTSGDRSTGDATSNEGEGNGKLAAKVDGATEDESEGEVCFICASKIEHISIAPCNHQTCHICALRLRALYKTRACANCRTESSFVIFTNDASKRYADFSDTEFVKSDDNLGIKFEKVEILEDTILLLRYNCPDRDCDVACWGWPDLHRHVKKEHGKVMCDLCTRNKKVFTHEHELFTHQELRKHERYGDDNPGAIDQSGFKGHPECGFCRQRFYGDDELYTHCRDKHEKCHICERRNGGRNPQYYLNYDSLEEHFKKDHFVCIDQECLAKKFVVFESEMDLKAHQLSEHPNGMSKDVRRDARVVDINAFNYRAPYQPERQRRGEREPRGGGRGRDPNADALPASSAQPMRRDEQAFQRQMAIQSAQSVTTRNFGGQLTQPVREPARPIPAPHSPPLPSIESLHVDAGQPAPASPQEQARRLRHQAVMDRASSLLKNDPTKLSDFRAKVSAYKSSNITATNLIDGFFSMFDAPSTELGKLVKELAEIYEIESKRTDLLKAWNDWRAINEDYPSLPGPSGALPGLSSSTVSGGSGGGSGGRRVLKLKSSTAASSRSAVSRHGSWGNALAAGTAPFPPLGGGGGGKKSATPWATSTTTSVRASPATSRPSSKAPPLSRAGAGSDAFPALPSTAKPNTLMAGLTKGTVRWDDGRNRNVGPPSNPWANGGGASPAPAALDSEESFEPAVGGKKGKGKKQVLYKFG